MSLRMYNAPSSFSYNKLLGLLGSNLNVNFEVKRLPLLTIAHCVLRSGKHLKIIRYAERWGIAVAIYDSECHYVLDHWIYPDTDATSIIYNIQRSEVGKDEKCILH